MSDSGKCQTKQQATDEDLAGQQAAEAPEEQRKKRPARRRRSRSADATDNRQTAGPESEERSSAEDASAKEVDEVPLARAEALMDRTGERIGHLALQTGQRLRRIAALAREEAEDIWAEARTIRNNSRSNGS